MKILAVDPGGTTGWAWLESGSGEFESGIFEGHEWEHVDGLVGLVVRRRPDWLVIEDFVLRPGLNDGAKSRRTTLSPVRITEALTYTLMRLAREGDGGGLCGLPRGYGTSPGAKGSRVVLQTAADAKRFASDERLRTWGMYVTPEHARDAMRHAVLFATKHRER